MKSDPRAVLRNLHPRLSTEELGKLFTRETPEAYRFFARGINTAELEGLPWYQRAIKYAQGVLPRLHDAPVAGAAADVRRRAGVRRDRPAAALPRVRPDARADPDRAVLRATSACRRRLFANGTLWLLGGFLLMNLLVLLEVADRLSLKRDLEVAREIQHAMLPEGTWSGPGVEAFGLTKPANTVGGDFYDILPQPDGTVHRRARRRRRQGEPRGAADGAAARDPAHARRRRPAAGRAGAAPEHAGRAPRAGVALHHAVPRVVHPVTGGSSSSTPARHRRCCAGKMDRSNG